MLKDLFNKHGADKARKHRYDEVYEPEFESFREKPINLLEVGVFKGDSVAAWLEYFPNATIYGIDIFQRVRAEDIDVLNQPRVKWLKCDSTLATVTSEIKKAWPRTKFDVIIDDGLHTPRANAQTLLNLWPLLKKDGAYYVEDVWPLHTMTLKQLEHPWLKRFPDRYNALEMEVFLKAIEDKTVKHFDNRKKSGEPDSYIVKVTN